MKRYYGGVGQKNCTTSHSHQKDKTIKRKQSEAKLEIVEEKSFGDVFEIKKSFRVSHGRETNNIVELYEFYKKNI